MIFTDENNPEGTTSQHSRELSFAITDSQHAFGIVPMQRDGRVRAFLVVVIVVFVFVESEVAIRAAVDPQLNRVGRFLRCPFLHRAPMEESILRGRKAASAPRSIGVERSSACDSRSRPEVVPSRFRQIQAPVRGMGSVTGLTRNAGPNMN